MKRLIGFVGCCILFLTLGIVDTKDISYLSLLVLPFTFLGDSLRYLSENGAFTNVVSIVLFISISAIPIGILIYKVLRKSLTNIEILLLPILSIALGRTLYLFINPHVLYDSLNPVVINMIPMESLLDLEFILLSGVADIFYILLGGFFISYAYINKKFDSIKSFKILIDIIIVISAFAVLSMGLSAFLTEFKMTDIVEEKSIVVMKYTAQILIAGLLIYLLNTFRSFIVELDKDGFQASLLKTLKKLSDFSFILLITSLIFQGVVNLYQFIVLDKLMNIAFTFDITIMTILVVSIILIFARYMTKVIEIKKENELFI